MHRKLLITLALVISLLFISACSGSRGSTTPLPEPQVQQEPVAQEVQSEEETADLDEESASEFIESEAEAEAENTALADFEEKVYQEAVLLRSEGKRMLEHDDNLEEARIALDGALNVILNSGLALDAHPRLANLFKDITRDVVHVEDMIAEADEETEVETTLADELQHVDIDDEAEDAEESGEKEVEPAVTFDLPVVQNARVEQFIKLFTEGRKRDEIAAGIRRSGQFIEKFKEILREEGVPEDLVYLAMIESTYKVRAYSRARAKGIWQFMSWTGKRYGLCIDWWVDERSDPYKACRAAARYLRDLHADLGDWLLAMAAYNGGPGRVGRAVRSMKTTDFWKLASTSRYLRRETRNFVPSILAAAIIMKQPEKYGFDDLELDEPWEWEEVKIDGPIDLRIIADLAGVSASDIQALNPALRRMITPQDYPGFTLRVPKGKGDGLEEKIAALPIKQRLKYAEHIVRRGDTLSGIAKRYGSSVSTIQQANNNIHPRRLKPGQHLVIPLSPGYSPQIAAGGNSSRIDASTGEKMTHVVQRGESLYNIARRYGTTVGSIAHWNELNPSRPIHPGNRLTVYAYTRIRGTSGGTIVQSGENKIIYRVRQGDTLYDIANRYKTTVSKLKSWNNLRRNLIRPGDSLTVYIEDDNSN